MKREPMLASPAPETPKFPLYASAKLDGIRGIVENGALLSRSGKKLPNRHLQAYFKAHPELNGLDGEIIVGEPNAKDVFRVTTSAVMSEDGEPDFIFYVFDDVTEPNQPYHVRQRIVMLKADNARVQVLDQVTVNNAEELREYEEKVLALGYEGLVLRAIDGRYKFGRSTTKEGLLLKLKRYEDDEAEVIGFTELMSNQNVAKEDAFGRTERSSHKDNMVPKNTLGALIVKDLKTKIEFQIGTGFDEQTRKEIWRNQNQLLGKIAKYKHFKVGVKDAPRFPVFIGWRDKIDMS